MTKCDASIEKADKSKYNTYMINVGIIEDDVLAANALMEHLSDFGRESGQEFNVKFFESADAFLLTPSKLYEVVFVDIELPGTDGMTAAKKLRTADKDIIIVFVTNVSRLAVEGYSVGALDYIIKPIEHYPFVSAMERVVRLIQRNRGISISVNTADGLVCLDSSSVLYVEAYGHYIIYHTEDGQVSEWGSLKKPEEFLTSHSFVRCSNCYLVNLKYVCDVSDNAVSVGTQSLKMSRTKSRTFIQSLNEFLSK